MIKFYLILLFSIFSFSINANESCVKKILDENSVTNLSNDTSTKVSKIEVANLFYDHSLNIVVSLFLMPTYFSIRLIQRGFIHTNHYLMTNQDRLEFVAKS